MNIRLAIQCCHFERRLCWMLSSLFDNYCNKDTLTRYPAKGSLEIHVAYLDGIKSNPFIEDVIADFDTLAYCHKIQNCFSIKTRKYQDKDRFAHRGLVRNDQMTGFSGDWLYFADTDHVFPPTYFCNLEKVLIEQKKDCNKVLVASRTSSKVVVNDLINSHDYDESSYIPHSFDRVCDVLHEPYKTRSVGAGYMQIIRNDISLHGGYYVPETRCKDKHMFNKGTAPLSDKQFRNRFGIEQLPEEFGCQIHLQHARDKGNNKHIEEQR